MPVLVPTSLDGVFDALASLPGAEMIAGGTDFMVEVNYARRRPRAIVSLRGVRELKGWRREGGDVVLGAGLSYAELMRPELSVLLPGLSQAARTVGSPQIRNAGTLGGNLGTASPAGDTLPVLSALDAKVVIGRSGGRRELSVAQLIVGPKRSCLQEGEVIGEIRLPAGLGSQEFLKVGTRNAMVIAVANAALVVDWVGRSVRCALGSVGPVILRASAAEEFAATAIDWDERRLRGGERDLEQFSALVREAARPIDDHRSTARYRCHAAGVCARRALERVLAKRAGDRAEEVPWES